MAKRSNLILIVGLAVFVLGAGATFLVVRNGGDSKPVASGGSSVLYAAKDIPAGTTGADASTGGLVKSRSADAKTKPANALTDPTQISNMKAVTGVPAGTVLTSAQFAVPQTSLGAVKIPAGKTALALQLAWIPGVAGFVASGDKIDVFAVAKDGPNAPSSKLIMQNTEVLSVSPSGATAQAAAAGSPIYLLAVSPAEAERLVYLTTFQQLYFSLVSKDAAAAGPTPGSDGADALKQLS
ncbi:MAG: Flp pilus assembly protein CpaB [Actinomycetota bacterium]|nr:Flp pilus assembly protein CpaB [Actinomycetota bacterium]